jgi:hypothetical protein
LDESRAIDGVHVLVLDEDEHASELPEKLVRAVRGPSESDGRYRDDADAEDSENAKNPRDSGAPAARPRVVADFSKTLFKRGPLPRRRVSARGAASTNMA